MSVVFTEMTGSSVPLSEHQLLGEILDELGLTQLEQRVYHVLAKFDGRPASIIAKLSQIRRTHAYDVLNRLAVRGFASAAERNGVRYYRCLPPDELLLLVERKEVFLAERRQHLSSVLKASSRPLHDFFTDPRTITFRGAEAKSRLLQELSGELTDDHNILICSADGGVIFEGLSATIDSIRKLLRFIPANLHIVLFSAGDLAEKLAAALGMPQVKGCVANFPVEILIRGARVTLVGKDRSQNYTMTIEQPALAASLRILAVPGFAEGRESMPVK